MQKKDPWYVSKRIYAAAVLLIATFAVPFGIEMDPDTQAVIVDSLTAIGVSVAALVSVMLNLWSKRNERNK